jgi:putative colanic acid biosynthesis acetyltransferase WcaF
MKRSAPAGSAGLTLDSISLTDLPEGTIVGHFSTNEKIRRLLWNMVQATLFRFSPRRADQWRASLLRFFGAKVGRVELLRNSVRVEVPWNLEIGDSVQIGDSVYLYSLGPIRIGERSIISQFTHICAGTHDFERLDFPLVRIPVLIGSDCWIATDTYIAPGIRIGDGVVVGARANVVRDLPAWTVCVGSPAKPVKARRLVDPRTGDVLSPEPIDAPEAEPKA